MPTFFCPWCNDGAGREFEGEYSGQKPPRCEEGHAGGEMWEGTAESWAANEEFLESERARKASYGRQESAPPEPSPPAASPSAPPTEKSSPWELIVGAVILLALLGLCAEGIGGKSGGGSGPRVTGGGDPPRAERKSRCGAGGPLSFRGECGQVEAVHMQGG
ncbi:MAG: hypothetical protein MUF54_07740 [Polyangiaceae bacterium]|nr:hypothetical protein [Polyangiaceae bacterium]